MRVEAMLDLIDAATVSYKEERREASRDVAAELYKRKMEDANAAVALAAIAVQKAVVDQVHCPKERDPAAARRFEKAQLVLHRAERARDMPQIPP